MKKLIITIILLFSYHTKAQTKAITDNGKEVVLFDNGTWKFVNESDAKTLETIITNESLFNKDKNASFLFRSKKLNIGIYINPKDWKVTDLFKSPFIEFAFINNHNTNLFAILTSENIEIATLKNLKEIIISASEKRADYFKLKESEYRTVNGLKVLYLRYIANIKGMDFEYVSYSYLTDNGYCNLSAYTTQKNFDESKPVIDVFLNGLVKTDKSETSSTIDVYQTPPPMQSIQKKKIKQ